MVVPPHGELDTGTCRAYVESTTSNIGYTPKAFYYCARVRTPVITASATGAGAATWTGDDMEFWLAPTDNRGQVRAKDTYQLLFNPAGGRNNTQGTGDAANPFNFKWASHTQFKLSVDGKLGALRVFFPVLIAVTE